MPLPTVRKVPGQLLSVGVPLVKENGEPVSLSRPRIKDEALSSISSWLNDEEVTEAPFSVEGIKELKSINIPKGVRIDYSDPFKMIAYKEYMELKYSKIIPVKYWGGDVYRIQDQIDSSKIPNWNGKKTRIRFAEIKDPKIRLGYLLNRTHWGKSLSVICKEDNHLSSWGRKLKRRLASFLDGKHDPFWSRKTLSDIYGLPYDKRPSESRANRLLEILKTVDGIFSQRYICFPEEAWTWERYDLFCLSHISILLCDEFLDGQLKINPNLIRTAYEDLKSVRKLIKLRSNTESWELSEAETPFWCSALILMMRRVSSEPCEVRRVAMGALLAQTRGASTPPPIVVLKSKEKFLRTISRDPMHRSYAEKVLISNAIDHFINGLPDSYFSGLSTKGRVTITSSACLEKTRKEGGTIEAISDIMIYAKTGQLVSRYNLDTGAKIDRVSINDITIGEYVFWSCLNHIKNVSSEELRLAYLTIVKEPGKARSVTKASAYLKVILDFVNKICSEPLKKGRE